MTESEWLASADPEAMLENLQWHVGHRRDEDGERSVTTRSRQQVSDRKMRLFACACCHLKLFDMLCSKNQSAIRWCEENDGAAPRCPEGQENMWAGCLRRGLWEEMLYVLPKEKEKQAFLLRDIFGNPWSPVMCIGTDWGEFIHHDRHILFYEKWLTWNDGIVRKLAHAIYDERAFNRMPILADALEEAGCTNENILMHCRKKMSCSRGPDCPPHYDPHVRGCWVIDLILGKE